LLLLIDYNLVTGNHVGSAVRGLGESFLRQPRVNVVLPIP
jgi:hypothetical protein